MIKLIKYLGIIFLIIVCTFLIWEAAVQPLVGAFFFSPEEYRGIDRYFSTEYLDYDNGDLFQSSLSVFPFLDDGTVVEFCYYDQQKRDNLFHGEKIDAFVLDVSMEMEYEKAKAFIIQQGRYQSTLFDYTLYWVKDTDEQEPICFLAALCDKSKSVRFIMVSSDSHFSPEKWFYFADSSLYRNFPIEWTVAGQ